MQRVLAWLFPSEEQRLRRAAARARNAGLDHSAQSRWHLAQARLHRLEAGAQLTVSDWLDDRAERARREPREPQGP